MLKSTTVLTKTKTKKKEKKLCPCQGTTETGVISKYELSQSSFCSACKISEVRGVPVLEHNREESIRWGLEIFACLFRNKIFSLEYQ